MSDTSTTLSASSIQIKLIDANPFQPRQAEDPEATAKIAESIRSVGLLQIPSARRVNGRYQLAFGHTRLAALRLLDAVTMPLNIVELTDLQMFEAAVSENIQRRDLNPVEVAQAMQRYMDDFGKTSEECGTFFGVSSATVRGKVRLLDLPGAAQSKLAEGAISEGTARALLSMAKVASEKEIQETLKDIEKNEDHEQPEEIIGNAIEQNDNVIEMHRSYDPGKPRAGRNLWLLDMKNFPNKLLEIVTNVDMVKALRIENDKEALKFIKDNDSFLAVRNIWAHSDNEVEAERAKILTHLDDPPACNACPFYMVMGGTHYCGMKVCHERKKIAFLEQKMQDLSRTLKIGVYQEADGPYLVLGSGVTSHKKAFANRHADLRLLPREEYTRDYAWQYFEELDHDVALLVAVGAGLEKLAVKGSKSVGKKSEKEKAEARAMRVYRQRRKELLWEYTAYALKIFEGVPLETLKVINRWHFIGIDDRIPAEHVVECGGDETLEFQRRELTWRLIVEETSHYRRDELVKLLDEFHEITKVRAPKSLVKRAQEWDAEIHALASVAVETKAPARPKGK